MVAVVGAAMTMSWPELLPPHAHTVLSVVIPWVRRASADTLIVADGTSCRHQIHDGSEREAAHVARVMAMSVAAAGPAAAIPSY